MARMPAAAAAWMPGGESSITRQSSGAWARCRAAARKLSGAGLPCSTCAWGGSPRVHSLAPGLLVRGAAAELGEPRQRAVPRTGQAPALWVSAAQAALASLTSSPQHVMSKKLCRWSWSPSLIVRLDRRVEVTRAMGTPWSRR